ncbi:hypothetical protein PYW08_010228 [Mythimna loreyi]|uniref:Uncharacterized protein n=1 Tax=Mythimna loreyi TaxID=667449 RepID=A0ACC2Q7M9_9NEOP|nr:hypothetical protein PYW08_010228 [Mythimna loreyi]
MDNLLYIFVIVFCVTNTNSLYAEGPNRILHGINATEGQFPYMVSVRRQELLINPPDHRCGGVLVTLQHALTAASCTAEPVGPGAYRVFAGSVLLTSAFNRVRDVLNITRYPQYNSTNNFYIHNIAILTLRTPFLSSTVTPISTIRDIGNAEMLQCNITGWGTNNVQLQYGRIQTRNVGLCSTAQSPVLPDMICGQFEYNATSDGIYPPYAGCPGDEGGPLICQGGLAGLIIDTRGCTSINSYPPHWYLRVSNYTTWINNITSIPVPTPPPETTTLPTPTLPTTTLAPTTTTTTPAPPSTPMPSEAASTFQPGMAVLAVVAVVQMMTRTILN